MIHRHNRHCSSAASADNNRYLGYRNMSLEKCVALVTGAASEIGYVYVKYLLEKRVKVLLCDVNVERCQRIAEEFVKEHQNNVNIFSTKCDVTDEDEFENAFKTCIKHFGRLDIVINNAGVFDNSIKRWSNKVNINYGGVVRGTLLAVKYMGIPNGGNGGIVIQTTSSITVNDNYLSTKKCVIEFTKSFGGIRNFSLHGVKIMSLCPEFTSTCTDYAGTICDGEHDVEGLDKLNKSIMSKSTADNIGCLLIEILEHGTTGETWIVENGKLPRLVEY